MTTTHRRLCFEHRDPLCLCCGTGSSLDVHHVDGNPTNDDLENLVVICKSCHRKVHNKTRENTTMSVLVDRLGEVRVPELDPADFEGVASTATLTTKETAPGLKYYYWQWTRNGELHSKYAAPVDECRVEYVPPNRVQSSLADW